MFLPGVETGINRLDKILNILCFVSSTFRATRVQNAKDQGQLLIFSPTFRNPASLPTPENASPMEDEARSENQNGASPNENLSTPENMKVESHRASESTRGSAELSNAQSEHIVSELRSLRETVNKLVEPRTTETPSKAKDPRCL